MERVSQLLNISRELKGRVTRIPAPLSALGNWKGAKHSQANSTRQFLTCLWSGSINHQPQSARIHASLKKAEILFHKLQGLKEQKPCPLLLCQHTGLGRGTYLTYGLEIQNSKHAAKPSSNGSHVMVSRRQIFRSKRTKKVWKKPAVGSSTLNKQAAKYVKSSNPFACLKYYSLDGSSQSAGFAVYPPQMTPR